MSEPHVIIFDDADPEMQRAYSAARKSFRYFWREMSWERRRIVPALDLACVKAVFSDGPSAKPAKGTPAFEQMWISEIDFDGEVVSGVLINSPNWLKTVHEGDSARFPLNEITDWMYAISGEVFGAFTVNVMRSRMGRAERKQHDDAWGLNFGDPAKPRLAPEPGKGKGLLSGWFGKKKEPDLGEHPMSLNMAGSLRDQLTKTPELLSQTDDRGWTFLHQESLAGNAATVKVLLDAGADPDARTNDGKTALQLARSLGWDNVVALLEN